MRKSETVYKANFKYKVEVNVSVKGTYYAGRPQTMFDPEEPAEFEIVSLTIDGKECDYEGSDYDEFCNRIHEELYTQNEHEILGYDPDYDPE